MDKDTLFPVLVFERFPYRAPSELINVDEMKIENYRFLTFSDTNTNKNLSQSGQHSGEPGKNLKILKLSKQGRHLNFSPTFPENFFSSSNPDGTHAILQRVIRSAIVGHLGSRKRWNKRRR